MHTKVYVHARFYACMRVPGLVSYTHTHTHTHTHTGTQAHTHARTHPRTQTQSLAALVLMVFLRA